MKDAIEHNPVMMLSLKKEVESQIEDKMLSIGISYKESLTKREYNAVNTQLDGQRKSLVSVSISNLVLIGRYFKYILYILVNSNSQAFGSLEKVLRRKWKKRQRRQSLRLLWSQM